MAFCTSSLGRQNHVNLVGAFLPGYDSWKCQSEILTVEVREFMGSRNLKCENYLDQHHNLASSNCGCLGEFCSNYHRKVISSGNSKSRRKWKLKILGMMASRDEGSGAVDSSSSILLAEESDISILKHSCDSKISSLPELAHGGGGDGSFGGNGGNGKFPTGGGEGGDNEDKDEDKDEFGRILKFEKVIREAEARGAKLPSDMLEAAKTIGIREVLLHRYLDLQGSVWPLGVAIRSCSLLRDRMLADPSFLFKVGTEIVIDSCCATYAEIQKRGKDFWAEFELYAADTLVGIVVDVALVGLLAPCVRIGQPSVSKGLLGHIKHTLDALPGSVFEADWPVCKFSIQQRIGTYFYKGVLYASVGFFCGLIGQGIANLIMTAKRRIKKSEEDIPVPPLLKSAALWGVFLAVSSNTRYQIINGLERLVDASPVAKRIPPVALAFTIGIRFGNNIYGGMQFVDWARWSGVQ